MWCLKTLLSSCLLVSAASAVTIHTHDETFVPDEVLRFTQVDHGFGGITRYSVLANGTSPGPPLRFQEGQTVWIRVYNDMTDANVTAHWHGVSQAAFPFADGSPHGAQFPVPPGHFFDYEVNFPVGSAGTYYYHSHVGFQASTGTGEIVVEEDGKKPYPVDGERTIFMQEIFNKTDQQALDDLHSVPFVWPGENSGWLINGKGIANQTITDPASAEYPIIDVTPGKKYRWRWIASSILSLAMIGIENHDNALQVIEADGRYTQPYPTKVMQIGAGQRYSTLFQAKTCSELAQLTKTHTSMDFYIMLQSRERPTTNTGYAILRYQNTCGFSNTTSLPTKSIPAKEPIALPPTDRDFLEYQLSPLTNNSFVTADKVNRRVYLNITEINNADGSSQLLVNNYSWVESSGEHNEHTEIAPDVPYLVAMYENATKYMPDYDSAIANGGLDPSLKVYPVKIGETIDIVLQHFGAIDGPGSNATTGRLDSHPWHHHGAHYWDLGSGPGFYDPEENEKKWASKTPVVRDTTMLFRYAPTTGAGQITGWRAWRVKVEDPGVWMAHCHMLHHFVMGMMSVWIHGDRDDILKLAYPDVSGYLTYGGNVVGNDTHHPEVIHFSEEPEYAR